MLARVCRVNIGDGDSVQLGLIFYERLELIERPTVQGVPERLGLLAVASYSVQLLHFYTASVLDGDVDYLLGNRHGRTTT